MHNRADGFRRTLDPLATDGFGTQAISFMAPDIGLGAIVGSSVIGLMMMMTGPGAEAHTLFEICALPGLIAAVAICQVAGHRRREAADEPTAGQAQTAAA
jgi:hypothetical protein